MWRDAEFNAHMILLDTYNHSVFDSVVTPAELEN